MLVKYQNRHPCVYRLVLVFNISNEGSVIMDDGTMVNKLGRGIANLKFTSEKMLTLCNIQHVLTIRKNLLSGLLFNN